MKDFEPRYQNISNGRTEIEIDLGSYMGWLGWVEGFNLIDGPWENVFTESFLSFEIQFKLASLIEFIYRIEILFVRLKEEERECTENRGGGGRDRGETGMGALGAHILHLDLGHVLSHPSYYKYTCPPSKNYPVATHGPFLMIDQPFYFVT